MFVADRMSKNPITVTPDVKVDEAAALMKKHGFRRLAVVDEGRVVGIISDHDVMKVAPSPATTLSRFEINSLLAKMTVKEIMNKQVRTIHVDATIEEAALIMYREKIGGLPVVSGMGAIVGMITATDIFKTFVDVMGLVDGKTRLTIAVTDKVGVVKEVAAVFAEMGINIDSLVSCRTSSGQYEIVIRGDFDDVAPIKEKLANKGYPVTHSVKIG